MAAITYSGSFFRKGSSASASHRWGDDVPIMMDSRVGPPNLVVLTGGGSSDIIRLS